MPPSRPAKAVARVVGAAARNPRPVLAAVLVVTVVLGAGATQFAFHNRFTEWVPQDDPDKQAFDRAVEDIPGTVNYEVVWLELDPAKTDETNITSPEALRAMDEFASYVRDRVPAISGLNGPLYWVKLANYANHGNDPAYFRVPQDPASMAAARDAAFDANADAMRHFAAADWSGALVAFPVGTDPMSPASNEAGVAVRDAVESYRQEDDLERDLFKDEYVAPVGVPSSSGVMDEMAEDAMTGIAPWAALAIGVALFLAFRRTRAVPLALATVGIAAVWVLGFVGWTGSTLNLFNLAIFPLILGNGIDYSIHVLHEARSPSRDGGDPDHGPAGIDPEAVAANVGVPILFVTATTVLGLGAMTLSSSTYLTELGIWASAAMIVTAALCLTFLPAAVSLWPASLPAEPPRARRLAAWARWGREHRGVLVAAVLAVSAVAAWSAAGGTYSVALMEDSFPRDAAAVQAKERFEEKQGGGEVAFVIYEGDVATREARDYMARVAAELEDRGVVARAASVYDLPLVLQGYEAVETAEGRAGLLAPAAGGDDGGRGSDMTGEEARAAIDEMYASPIWHSTIRTIVSPGQDRTVAYVNPTPRGDTLEAAAALDAEIQGAVEAAGPAPDGVETHTYGFKLMAHDFLEFSITWLWILFGLTFSATVLGAWLLLRDARAVAAVAAPMAVSGLWWLGLLPVFGISVTIYLFVAVLFITSIGSDYAAYLAWKAREEGSLPEAYATTGRAVLYAAVTDGGAFLAFSFVAIPSASEMMFAAFLAIATIFVATALVLPAVLPRAVGEAARDASEAGASRAAAGAGSDRSPT